jgi:hypothetical protein
MKAVPSLSNFGSSSKTRLHVLCSSSAVARRKICAPNVYRYARQYSLPKVVFFGHIWLFSGRIFSKVRSQYELLVLQTQSSEAHGGLRGSTWKTAKRTIACCGCRTATCRLRSCRATSRFICRNSRGGCRPARSHRQRIWPERPISLLTHISKINAEATEGVRKRCRQVRESERV